MRRHALPALTAVAAAILLAILSSGCSEKVVAPQQGALVSIALGEKAQIAEHVRVTVTAADMSPIGTQVELQDGLAQVELSVPVGATRLFVIEVFTSSEQVLYRGERVVDVLPFMEGQVTIDLRPMLPMLYFTPHFPAVRLGDEMTLVLRAAKLPGLHGLSFVLDWDEIAPVQLQESYAAPGVLEAGAEMWSEGRYFGINSGTDSFVDADGNGALAHFRFSTYEMFAAGAYPVPFEIELNDLSGMDVDPADVYLSRALLRLVNPNAVETILGSTGPDEGRAVVALPGGDFMVAGAMGGGGQDYYQAPFLARIAPDGQSRWLRTYPSEAIGQIVNDLARSSDGSLYLVGGELGYHKEVSGSFLYRTDGEGRLVYETTLDTVLDNPVPSCVAALPGGGAVVAGYYRSGWWNQCFVATFSAFELRDVLLILDYGAVQDIVAVSDTAFVAVGTQDAMKAGDIVLWRVVSADGLRLSWTRIFSGYDDEGIGLAQAADGDLYIAGTVHYGRTEMRVIRTDPDGFARWDHTLEANATARAIVATPDGGCVVVGDGYVSEQTGTDVVVVRLDAAGNTVWERTYGGAGTDRAYGVVRATGGGYLVVGTTDSARPYDNDVLLLRLNEEGLKAGAE